MSQKPVEVARRMQEAFLSGQFDAALALLAPDVVYDARERLDGRIWHGREGVREAMLEWASVWDDWEVDVESYVEAGDDAVLVLWRERGRGKGSSVSIEQRGANLVTVAGGHITSLRLFIDQRRALRAVGSDRALSQQNL